MQTVLRTHGNEDWFEQMKRTFREKVIIKNRNRLKRHPKCKALIALQQKLVLFGYDIGLYFAHNGKRYACLFTTLTLFFVSSSFAFPKDMAKEVEEAVLSEQVQQVLVNTDAELSDENIIEPSEIGWIDDDEVSDGTEDDAFMDTDDVDTYSLEEILEDNEMYQEPNRDFGESETLPVTEFDKDDWQLILINKQHPIPDDYTFPLGTIKNNMQCDERIIEDLLLMMQAAKKDGVALIICSPYRDYSRQEILFNRKIDKYMSWGMSYMEAYKKASQTVTVPGASEHQIGLAIDFITNNYTKLNAGFGDTEAGKWLKEHSCEYGFILRYPLGKEYITGIQYEPWHFRYVGKDAAMTITEQEITLEEFVEGL